jgi:hypothetical protein
MFFCIFCPNLLAIQPAVNIVDLSFQTIKFFHLIFQILTEFKNFKKYGLKDWAERWAERFWINLLAHTFDVQSEIILSS